MGVPSNSHLYSNMVGVGAPSQPPVSHVSPSPAVGVPTITGGCAAMGSGALPRMCSGSVAFSALPVLLVAVTTQYSL